MAALDMSNLVRQDEQQFVISQAIDDG